MSSRFRGATGGVLLMGCYWWGATGGVLLVGCYWWGAIGGVLLVGCYWWGATGGVLLVGNGTRTRFGVAPLLDTSSCRMPLHA